MAVEKKRVSTTLTEPYMKFLDQVVKQGIYLTPGGAFRAALRLLMKDHGVPLNPEEAEA